MRKSMTAMAACVVFTACDGNPFDTTTASTTTGPVNTSTLALPPGTTDPSAGVSIYRYEELDANGSGYAEAISYDSVNDRFFVDNLAFDGDNFYERDDQAPNLGPFKVYENDSFLNDPSTGTPINQFQHKAIYGVSTSGKTEFAIVRTGQYVDYGFGGFLYQRNVGVTLPTSGQAVYSGQYAGIRDFLSRGGLEYVVGDAAVAIDFADFNDGSGVRGQITNRRVFDINGVNITQNIIDAINNTGFDPANPSTPGTYANITELPTLLYTIGPNTADANGEMTGFLNSQLAQNTGAAVTFESGTYYAMVAGDNAEEIVGIVVVTSTDPRYTGVTTRETGGFVVYR